MVKKVDEFRIDHIGWRLWDAATVWKEKFASEMVAMGHVWYREARSSIIPYIRQEGTRQTEIVERMGLSKQAVQQLIVDLEDSGIVHRVPDPNDGRGKIVCFTEIGLAAQSDSNKAKKKVEEELKSKLGPKNFEQLVATLEKICSDS